MPEQDERDVTLTRTYWVLATLIIPVVQLALTLIQWSVFERDQSGSDDALVAWWVWMPMVVGALVLYRGPLRENAQRGLFTGLGVVIASAVWGTLLAVVGVGACLAGDGTCFGG
jgi:hypothetical protein